MRPQNLRLPSDYISNYELSCTVVPQDDIEYI